MMAKERISLGMSTDEIVAALSDGNPGAMAVIMSLLMNNPINLMMLLRFDSHQMYGSDIWDAYQFSSESSDELVSNLKDPVKFNEMKEYVISRR